MPKKYVPNGRPHGGKRADAGRKDGTKNTLGYGEVKAVKAAGLRVPDDATKDQRELADRALERIADVMEAKVWHAQAGHVMKAAVHLREEICGSIKQKVEHSLAGLTDEQLEAQYRAAVAKALEAQLADGEPKP